VENYFIEYFFQLQHKPAPGSAYCSSKVRGSSLEATEALSATYCPGVVDDGLDFSFTELDIRQGQVEAADGDA